MGIYKGLEGEGEELVVCAASAYEQKFYFNPIFEHLPLQIKNELKIMCVLFTEDIGGVLSLQFDRKGNLDFHVEAKETDLFYDEIGSRLKINQIIREKQELLRQLQMYYQAILLKS